MHRKRCLFLAFCTCLAIVAALSACADYPLQCPECAGLFIRETPVSDSMYREPYVPTEAQPTFAIYVTPEPTETPLPSVTCPATLDLLPGERVAGVPSSTYAFCCFSPSGRYVAIDQAGKDRVVVLDMETTTTKEFEAPGLVWFWSDDSHCFLDDWSLPPQEEDLGWYSLDTTTGEKTFFESRWEYNGPDQSLFTREFYTGWQAAEALTVDEEVICDAVKHDMLHPVVAADGSLLLTRKELLERGADIVYAAYPEMIPASVVTELCSEAEQVQVIGNRTFRDAPLTRQFTPNDTLILTGLPEEPHNLRLTVTNAEHLAGYPIVPNDATALRSYSTSPEGDPHPDYFLSDKLCQVYDQPAILLLAKGIDGEPATPLGVISYAAYPGNNVGGNRSDMVWSPDGHYIYVEEWVNGEFALYRIVLP